MPLATFPGQRGWGYDGVDLFAPFPAYGTPAQLAAFVRACHACGLAVLLDVVYNHLGPDGNYLASYGPYFTDRYKTGWGAAINYDGPQSDEVRRFVIDNALMWLKDYEIRWPAAGCRARDLQLRGGASSRRPVGCGKDVGQGIGEAPRADCRERSERSAPGAPRRARRTSDWTRIGATIFITPCIAILPARPTATMRTFTDCAMWRRHCARAMCTRGRFGASRPQARQAARRRRATPVDCERTESRSDRQSRARRALEHACWRAAHSRLLPRSRCCRRSCRCCSKVRSGERRRRFCISRTIRIRNWADWWPKGAARNSAPSAGRAASRILRIRALSSARS